MKRVPFTQRSFLWFIPKCLQAHSDLTYVTPTFGSIVVNGKLPIGTGVSVAAEKKVDFPTLAFPSKPICNIDKNPIVLISIEKLFNPVYVS